MQFEFASIRVDSNQRVSIYLLFALTARSGVCGVTDQRFHNSREMFEFYATKSCLFLLKAMYVMGNLSDIMDLLILWRLDALFGCGRANSEVDAWSGER